MKKVFIYILIFSLTLSDFYPLFAQELSLSSLIEEALKNNPEILSARKTWEASQARVPQSKSLDNPTVGISFEKIPKGTLKLNKTMPEDRMLSISQTLPFFGKLSTKGKIALIESQMIASEYKLKELEIINEVKNAYNELYIHHKNAELHEESIRLLKDISRIAESRYAVGEVEQEEVLKIHLEIARLSNEIENHNKIIQAKEAMINSILNRDIKGALGEPTIKEDISFNKDIDTLYKLTLENQPELAIFNYAIERNKYSKQLAELEFLPDFMPQLTLRNLFSGGFGLWDFMLALSVPFWFWTKQRYGLKEAINNLESAQAAYQAMKNKMLFETKDLFTKLEIARNRIRLYRENLIPIAKQSIEASLAGFKSGKSDFMMLLDSNRMLIDIKMGYYNTLVEYEMALADLERTVGVNLR